ncbi:sensor histidine kinase [Bartonella schoenbuchensis]|uniref:histidine kinase n=2 Tax=Bartonella schoenbuchensis TaxID=165694 RepID=E6YY93_BARSR|nr:ATP-binding protein [Bartonella schoenbuchensis]AQX30374.1 Signal transduction histidine kinase [Bartonella schoenbuchensis R1]CBI81904.1 sensor histidine kinase [Bartonella schoenbuchensis R1]CDP79857.1 sensor histidine kinase [Bartonella schoenbuchensis]
MNRLINIMRTTALRLSALYILLFSLVAAGLSIYMTAFAVSLLTDQTEQALREELRNIESAYNYGGLSLLMRTIDYRSRQPGAFLYLVTDPMGRILTGNVARIEPGLLKYNGFLSDSFLYSRFGEHGKTSEHRALAVVVDLPNAMKLLVGRDLDEPERFAKVIRKAVVIALIAMVGGALLIWFFVGRRALQRIDRVTAASQHLMDGDFSERLPVSQAGDEFDRLSANLNVMLDRIEELNIGLRQVSDNIAHDLKTPLTRLRNRAEEALSGQKTELEYRQALDDVIAESDQLIRTFNAILMISRIEASSSIAHLEPMNVKLILEDAVELYEPFAEEAGILLRLGHVFDKEVRLNRELIAQSIFNLIDNAIKYAPSGEKNTEISLSMEYRGECLLVVVSDNGPGIAEDKREKVTERFVRLEKSRTQPGCGIGLSIAKAVMKFHGGELLLEDANPGLRAVLMFP